MVYFYSFIALFLIVMTIILLYHEVLNNANLLEDTCQTILKLSGKIHCANSEHDCDKAQTYKMQIKTLEAQYAQAKERHNKLLSKYDRQYKLFSLLQKKLNLKKPDEFKINY